VWSAGNITKAVQNAKLATGFSCKIEVECRTVEEAHEAVRREGVVAAVEMVVVVAVVVVVG